MDPFDKLLISTASILVRGVGAGDDYGVAPTIFTTVATGIPCRVSAPKRRIPKEQRAEKKTAENYHLVFMRPWFDSDGNPLSHLHWLLINADYYDVFQVMDPSFLGHHFEVWCELILT